MTNRDLREAMTDFAERASTPPTDLLERVESGFRVRRHRRYRLTAAFATVLVLTLGAWVALRPTGHDVAPAGFRLPPLPARVPLLTETWPGATVFDAPPATPYGTRADVIGRIDAKHLLATSPGEPAKPAALWSYAAADRSYRELLKNPPFSSDHESVMVTPSRLVYVQNETGRSIRVWYTARGGGLPLPVATIKSADPAREIYADNEYVYYTLRMNTLESGLGVVRVSLKDGTSEHLSGFEKMFTYGAPWAINIGATEFRYLATGELRRAVRPPGADKFQCVPAFCLAHDADGWFLQRVDGTGRTGLPYPGTPRMVGGFSTRPDAAGHREDAGLLLLDGGLLLDPVRGKLGRLPDESSCEPVGGWIKDELVVQWYPRVDGKCVVSGVIPRTAYIGASD